MVKIIRVDILDDSVLDIEFDNGSLILFDILPLIKKNSKYKELEHLELLPPPKTDGHSIFWEGGIRVLVEEIVESFYDDSYKVSSLDNFHE